MEKILVIGDYNNDEHKELALFLKNKYSSDFDILISGRNLSGLQGVKTYKKTSAEYAEYIITAKYVIILDDETKFKKYNDKQNVFLFNNHNLIDEQVNANDYNWLFLIIAKRINCFLYNQKEDIKKGNIIKSSLTFNELNLDDIFSFIQVGDKKIIDIIVISSNEKELVCSSQNYPGLFKALNKNEFYNIIYIQLRKTINVVESEDQKYFSCFFNLLNKQKVVLRFLSRFNGLVIYDDVEDLAFFKDELLRLEIQNNQYKALKLEETKGAFLTSDNIYDYLCNINEDSTDEFDKEKKFRTAEYHKLLNEYYENNEINAKISVVICDYNTPREYLYRAIDSVLNSTYQNIEIVIINDGSLNDYKDELYKDYEQNKDVIKYIYSENQGLGLARNLGVNNASGDYIFFLDGDDTISEDGLRLMITHMFAFDLELVVGKRVICDENGNTINESMKYISGNTYKAYYAEYPSIVYFDQMANNKLIDINVFKQKNIWFEKGVYEDSLFSAKLYSILKEYHTTNIHIHNWYKYEHENTLSSIKSYENFEEKYNALMQTWRILPDNVKQLRLYAYYNSDYNNYYSSFDKYSDEDKLNFFNKMKLFYQETILYLDKSKLSKFNYALITTLKENDYEAFKKIVEYHYSKRMGKSELYDNYIVNTYYHLLVAIARTLESNNKTRLFIYKDYQKFDKQFILKLKSLNIFDEIIEFSNGAIVGKLYNDLNNNEFDYKHIIPTYLYNKYLPTFGRCNIDDNVYIFSDTLPYFYILEKRFNNIIKLEDAYNSFKRETEVLMFTGLWKEINTKYDDVLPIPLFVSDKIKKIIVSQPIDGLNEVYSEKLVIEDTKELFMKQHSELGKIFSELFEIESILKPETVMLLTQPLANVKYCTPTEQRKLYQNILSHYDKENVIIKPHPADPFNYSNWGYPILNKNIPIEVYNFLDYKIAKIITFGSSAVETIEFAQDKEVLFKMEGFEFDDVSSAISKITWEQRPNIIYRLKKFPGKVNRVMKKYGKKYSNKK